MKKYPTGSALKIEVEHTEDEIFSRLENLEREVDKFKNPICGRFLCRDVSVGHGHFLQNENVQKYELLLHNLGLKTEQEDENERQRQLAEKELKHWWSI